MKGIQRPQRATTIIQWFYWYIYSSPSVHLILEWVLVVTCQMLPVKVLWAMDYSGLITSFPSQTSFISCNRSSTFTYTQYFQESFHSDDRSWQQAWNVHGNNRDGEDLRDNLYKAWRLPWGTTPCYQMRRNSARSTPKHWRSYSRTKRSLEKGESRYYKLEKCAQVGEVCAILCKDLKTQ